MTDVVTYVLFSQTIQRMPDNIHDRILHDVNTAVGIRLTPTVTLVNDKIDALSAAQTSAVDTITQSLDEIRRITTRALCAKTLKNRDVTIGLENTSEQIPKSQEISVEADTGFNAMPEGPSSSRSIPTNITLRNTHRPHYDTAKAIRMQSLGTRSQPSSLLGDHDQADATTPTQELLYGLSNNDRRSLSSNMAKSGIEKASQDILGSIWLLLSSLQRFISELV